MPFQYFVRHIQGLETIDCVVNRNHTEENRQTEGANYLAITATPYGVHSGVDVPGGQKVFVEKTLLHVKQDASYSNRLQLLANPQETFTLGVRSFKPHVLKISTLPLFSASRSLSLIFSTDSGSK